MYENLHNYENLFRENNRKMEQEMERCRKLKASRINNEIREKHNILFMLLLAFRNIGNN